MASLPRQSELLHRDDEHAFALLVVQVLRELEDARERGVGIGRRGEDLVDVGRERPPALRGRQLAGDAHRRERSAGGLYANVKTSTLDRVVSVCKDNP